jgi:hypothetical protein
MGERLAQLVGVQPWEAGLRAAPAQDLPLWFPRFPGDFRS